MKILHTSDWHLGRLFHNVHLTEDQAHVLESFVALARDVRPDLIVIAGDLYDRAVPPPEAVELLDDVLGRLVLDLGIPTVAIAGNHDSAERIGFASRLLAGRGLHLAGPVERACPFTIEDAHGPVEVVPLPYASPEAVRSGLKVDVHGHDEALRAQLAASVPNGVRRVAVAHAFVTGGQESESERALTVGGTGAVDASLFEGFSYVALGHLHRPQSVTAAVRYSGSLLPYSFGEVDHRKGVLLVELDAAGAVVVEQVALSPLRGMRVIEGTIDELLADSESDPARDDYVLARITDKGLVLDAMERIRAGYPKVLHIERPSLTPDGPLLGTRLDHRRMDPLALFEDFYAQVCGEALSDELRAEVASAADAVQRRDA